MQNPNFILMFHNAIEVYEEMCREICREADLHQVSFDIMMFLANNPDFNTACDITNIRGIKKNMVSFHVERLVRGGYLERKPIPEDRRKVRLVLTPKAEPVVEKGREVQRRFYEYASEGISEEEIEIYKKCNQIFADNMAKLKFKIKGGQI